VRIVVAEDDLVFRRFLEASLRRWGYDVTAAADGRQACQALLKADAPALAIVDWNMPERDGLDVCREVRRHRGLTNLFILMLTARSDAEDLSAALDAGANDYVTKPFDGTELRARLEVGRRIIASRPALDSAAIAEAYSGLPADGAARDALLTPIFDPQSMKFTYGMASAMLRAWEADGLLETMLIDRVQVCPRCQGLPSFRFGCPGCGSARVTNDRLIHHYACGHVDHIAAFEQSGELVCPKCRTRKLVVGSDFEHLVGPYRCFDCDWSAAELEHVAHCLRCDYRFPAHQAFVQDLIGYHARRVDALADVAADR
jgi:DNA-binding response OmpR family regulator